MARVAFIAVLLLFAVCVAGVLLNPGSAQTTAQGPALRGRIVDSRGQAVAGARVSLRETGARQSRTTLSAADGAYSYQLLATGLDYELWANYGALTSSVALLRISDPGEKATIELRLGQPIVFEDAAATNGLDFVLRNGATGKFHLPEIMTGGVAAFDYDNDGCTDIYFANGAAFPSLEKTGPEFRNRLYRNDCTAHFEDVSEQAGIGGSGYAMAIASADFDNDGHSDVFVAGLNGNTLYRNRGDGTFADVTKKSGLGAGPKSWSVSSGWFDYDNDGWLDLFVSNYVAWDLRTAPVCGSPQRRFYCHPKMFPGSANQLFRNNRDGTFTDVSDLSGIAYSVGKGMGVAFGDYDDNGFLDVFVANDSVPNFLFRNNGNGTFTEVAVSAGTAYTGNGNAVASMGADFRDVDNDGLEDLAVTAMYFDTFPLFRNRGKPHFFDDATLSSGLFAATKELTGWGIGVYDLDNDGFKDIFLATSHFPQNERNGVLTAAKSELANHVLRNAGNGWFDDVSGAAGSPFAAVALHHGAAFADFDNDGRVDVAVSALNSPARLFLNRSPLAAHWLGITLVGRRGNRSGLGGKVKLTLPNGESRYNRAGTAVGYASSSEAIVRFGMGPYSAAREIEVIWPGGRVQRLRGVAADQIVKIEEP